MDLGYEISKFGRNDMEIIDEIEQQLGVSLIPFNRYIKMNTQDKILSGIISNNTKSDYNSLYFANCSSLYFANLNTDTKVLVYLDDKVGHFLNNTNTFDSLDYLAPNIDPKWGNLEELNLKKKIVESYATHKNSYVLFFNYDFISVRSSTVSLSFPYTEIRNIKAYLHDGFNSDLYQVLKEINGVSISAGDYIYSTSEDLISLIEANLDKKMKLSKGNKELEDELIYASTSLQMFRDYVYSHNYSDLDIKNEIIKINSGIGNIAKRRLALARWSALLHEDLANFVCVNYTGDMNLDRSYTSLTDGSCWNFSAVNTAKDLVKLFFVASYSIYNDIRCVKKYISFDSDDFKVPYEIYEGVYADGNLSKQRAYKKFIDALKSLSLNLSDFEVIV